MTGPRMQHHRSLPTAVLLGVTASWGSTFFLIKDLLHEISVVDFLALRFVIAGLAAFAVAHRSVFRLSRADVMRACVLGVVYGSAQLLQTAGLSETSASVTGFVTGMYVIATPVFSAAIFRERIRPLVWLAVALAGAGLAFLALNGFSVSFGVALVFVAALIYALHILGLGQWSRTDNAVGLSVVQLMVIGLVCLLATAFNGVGHPTSLGGWSSLVYMALVPGALAILGQTWAQAHLSATRTAIVMTTEPVWAAFFAVLFGGDSLTARMIVGGVLVLGAMYLVELSPRDSAVQPPGPDREPSHDSPASPQLPL